MLEIIEAERKFQLIQRLHYFTTNIKKLKAWIHDSLLCIYITFVCYFFSQSLRHFPKISVRHSIGAYPRKIEIYALKAHLHSDTHWSRTYFYDLIHPQLHFRATGNGRAESCNRINRIHFILGGKHVTVVKLMNLWPSVRLRLKYKSRRYILEMLHSAQWNKT